jgi:uncharacterized membrane protein
MAAPPPPPTSPRPPGSTQLGVAPNVGGLLCYAPCCIGLIFSIVVVIVEKQNRFLRFHAFQGLLFHAALFVVAVAVQILLTIVGFVSAGLALIGHMLWLLIALGILAAEILLMVKAYNNEEYELPTLGPLARKYMA